MEGTFSLVLEFTAEARVPPPMVCDGRKGVLFFPQPRVWKETSYVFQPRLPPRLFNSGVVLDFFPPPPAELFSVFELQLPLTSLVSSSCIPHLPPTGGTNPCLAFCCDFPPDYLSIDLPCFSNPPLSAESFLMGFWRRRPSATPPRCVQFPFSLL